MARIVLCALLRAFNFPDVRICSIILLGSWFGAGDARLCLRALGAKHVDCVPLPLIRSFLGIV